MLVELIIWFLIILVALVLLMYWFNPKGLRGKDGKRPCELKTILYCIVVALFTVIMIGLAICSMW